jgi:hypothetical protein
MWLVRKQKSSNYGVGSGSKGHVEGCQICLWELVFDGD